MATGTGRRLATLSTLLLLSGACTRDPVGPTADTTPPPTADTSGAPSPPMSVLLVVDDSDSMLPLVESLAVGLDAVEASLPDDARIGVITTDVERHQGALLGRGMVEGPERIEQIRQILLCEATCFEGPVAEDPDHMCGEPLGSVISRQYLDCECGEDQWLGHCGTAVEEGLEAVFLALCRASEQAPAACTESVDTGEQSLPPLLLPSDLGTQPALIDERVVVPVFLSDEGNTSRRLEHEEVATLYLELFALAGVELAFGAVLPEMKGGQLICPGTSTEWAVRRYLDAVERTRGAAVSIHEDCELENIAEAMVDALRGTVP